VVRLIHLNGPPGIGKSTIASAFADRHPGVRNLDIELADFEAAAAAAKAEYLQILLTANVEPSVDQLLTASGSQSNRPARPSKLHSGPCHSLSKSGDRRSKVDYNGDVRMTLSHS
jgi:ABC-type cobalamin transport system ATPase subunit